MDSIKSKLDKSIAILIVFIFTINLLALFFSWYYLIRWFDMPMHFLGGVWVGLFAIRILYFRGSVEKIVSLPQIILGAATLTLIIGLGWEVFEYILGKTASLNPITLADSLSDLSFDMAGSLASVLYFTLIFKKQDGKN